MVPRGPQRDGDACCEPLAAIYGWAAAYRYARAKPYRSRLPVICVGNFTAGGHGQDAARRAICAPTFERSGQRPVVLTRGYGGRHAGPHWVGATDTASDVGDEALLLARVAPTLVARDRGAGARAVRDAARGRNASSSWTTGMQNPQLAKDLSHCRGRRRARPRQRPGDAGGPAARSARVPASPCGRHRRQRGIGGCRRRRGAGPAAAVRRPGAARDHGRGGRYQLAAGARGLWPGPASAPRSASFACSMRRARSWPRP